MKTFAKILAAAAVSLAPAAAFATPITTGVTINPATTVTYTPTATVTSITNASFVSSAPAGISPTIMGTYSEFVYKDSSNTLCATAGSCLTFVISVSNNTSSTQGIEHVYSGAFSPSFTYNVGYSTNSGSQAPTSISDDANNVIAFNFGQGSILAAGSTSYNLVIQTSATNFTAGSIGIIDSQTATVAGFLPSVAVTPEPSSLMLLGTGLMGVAGTMLRRRRNAV